MIGAAMPMASYVGSRPTPTVATPMVESVRTSMALRPSLSPRCPVTMLPRGRAMKLTPRLANAASAAVLGSSAVKNCWAKIS